MLRVQERSIGKTNVTMKIDFEGLNKACNCGGKKGGRGTKK